MKVVHVEAGRHLYGGALQVVFLLEGLQSRGIESVLVCPPGAEVGRRARELGIDVREIPLRGDHDLPFIARLVRLLRRERPDILHLHSRRGADTLGGIAGRLAGVPTVLSRRVDNPEPRWLVAVKYRLYDRVITISEAIKRLLVNEGVSAARVHCIHSAVDSDLYRPMCDDRAIRLRSLGVPGEMRAAAVIAQLIPRKGHETLIEAITLLPERHKAVRWLFLGQGPLRESLQAVASRRGVSERVVFCGFRGDLPHLLPCLDLVVHPAVLEGLGVSLLQAAACGVPVVASATGGIPEVVADPNIGRLVPPGDAEVLAREIVGILDDPFAKRRAREHGRRIIETRFSIDSMVDGNAGVYRSVLGSASPEH